MMPNNLSNGLAPQQQWLLDSQQLDPQGLRWQGCPPTPDQAQQGQQQQMTSGSQNLPQASPSMLSTQSPMQLPAGVRPKARPFAFPTMTPEVFSKAFPTFCLRNGIAVDQNVLQFEGRPIDLHALHTEVLGNGGSGRVSQYDLWPAIGAKLGFVQFPGSDTEPAKSGPGVAQHLQNVYHRYLSQFDNMFVSSVMKLKRPVDVGNGGQPGSGTSGSGHTPVPTTNTMSNNTPGNNVMGAPGLTIPPGFDPKLINELVTYARRPAEELRRQGVPEHVVNIVEQNRPILEASLRSQQDFHGRLAKQAQANGGMGMQPNMAPGFPKTPQMPQGVPSSSTSPAQQQQMSTQVQQSAQTNQPQNGTAPAEGPPMPPQVPKPFVDIANGKWPNPEELAQANTWLEATRDYFLRTRGKRAMPFIAIPDSEKQEWHIVFRELLGYLNNLSNKLPMLICGVSMDASRNMTNSLLTCLQQRSFLESKENNGDCYMLTLAHVRSMRESWHGWTNSYRRYEAMEVQRQQQHQMSISQVHEPVDLDAGPFTPASPATSPNATSDGLDEVTSLFELL
ncbi:uncharacterized protein B0H18DRAFT_1209636 [Fomitopsis serialis]|uniref:uncharacterized protein n=1 Tax=Fomitopsis serialis TaxID=139415 RepID=UPI00200803B2|nr:uncharacterized protein B0H18DRAFT_1209636 [Neoantrodia serialis]KAH9930150.1 hypothetical protein B0H18DRAFT_1209636 [Neoantrodia serialis]